MIYFANHQTFNFKGESMLEKILSAYGIPASAIIQPFGSGLINYTWKIRHLSDNYILQKINHDIFKEPWHIADNIDTIARYLEKINSGYFFVSPVKTTNGQNMLHLENEGYFRLFPFVKNSHTNNVAESPQQAFQAARQFGLFTKVLKSLPANTLKTTLPDFHNLTMRYNQFIKACAEGNPSRIEEAKEEIEFLRLHDHIVSTFKEITQSPDFKLRVTHHDTKISNVLFDEEDKGICVIDLDTVMPGIFYQRCR